MMAPKASRVPERGSAMMITMILVVALLAGGVVLVGMQLSSNRATDVTKSGMTALHCAEAGLSAARPLVAANYPLWAAALVAGTEPAFLSAIDHDIDNDGANDFVITLIDNDDELPPAANDRASDSDLRVFIASRCIKFPDTPKQVTELVFFNGGGQCYNSKQAGCGGNNNGTN